ncbi:hypothetical protein [Deinococcus sp.]|uniref:hypothetical protein n=1 Tax=Deinococcus sp. TaxID=47478 RepID=UPI003B593C08
MKPFVFHLVGPPASGKRTIGLALSRLTGAVLLDNHLFNDAVFKPYGADGLRPVPDEIHALAAQIRKLGLEAARLAPPDVSQIFTSYLTNRPSGPAALHLVRDLAAARSARYMPVWLECNMGELERRIALPERLERPKMREGGDASQGAGDFRHSAPATRRPGAGYGEFAIRRSRPTHRRLRPPAPHLTTP